MAELRFRISGGMVEPLIFGKEKGDLLKVAKIHRRQKTLGPKLLMCGVWLTQITAVYIQLFQWFVMISLFSSSKPPRPVCNKQTSPIL